jgi:hypothetical protein
MAEIGAAEFLRHEKARPAERCYFAPEWAGKADGVLVVAELPERRHRRLVAEEVERGVAQ